ncbi:hypothetical protein J5A63_01025 [Prevotella jejuni]|nr:RHS domain-containing protein [Prevotella jejuni]QUB81081.1 hypothetical protein J5A63_01025 [Prevotella jejuni]
MYEEGSYVPVAKVQNGDRYTIISDYMGRPVEAYNSYGNVVWQADYDIYGDLRNITQVYFEKRGCTSGFGAFGKSVCNFSNLYSSK